MHPVTKPQKLQVSSGSPLLPPRPSPPALQEGLPMTLLFLLSTQPVSFPVACFRPSAACLPSSSLFCLSLPFPHQAQLSLPNTGSLTYNHMFFFPPTWTAPVPGASLYPQIFVHAHPPKLLPLISACEASQVHPAKLPSANWDPLPLSVGILCISTRSVLCWLFV